jgi:hypothetical protein
LEEQLAGEDEQEVNDLENIKRKLNTKAADKL